MSKFFLFPPNVILDIDKISRIYIDDRNSPPCVVVDLDINHYCSQYDEQTIIYKGNTVEECEDYLKRIIIVLGKII